MRKGLVGRSIFSLFLIFVFTGLPVGHARPWNDGQGYRGRDPNSPRGVVPDMNGAGSRGHPPTIGGTFRLAVRESGEIMRDLLPWNWGGYRMAIGTGAVTLPLLLAKDDIQRAVGLDAPGNGVPPDAISFVANNEFDTHFEFLGGETALPALSGAFVIGGMLLKSRREVETGLLLAQSLLFSAAVAGLGQFVFAEERPYQGGDLRFFRTHGHGVSGHAAVSASMVMPIDRQYLTVHENDGKPLVAAKYLGKGILYSAPVMVGVSRVRSNRHYVWNVVLGLGIGYSVGKVVADVHERSQDNHDPDNRAWRASLGAGGASLSLTW